MNALIYLMFFFALLGLAAQRVRLGKAAYVLLFCVVVGYVLYAYNK